MIKTMKTTFQTDKFDKFFTYCEDPVICPPMEISKWVLNKMSFNLLSYISFVIWQYFEQNIKRNILRKGLNRNINKFGVIFNGGLPQTIIKKSF